MPTRRALSEGLLESTYQTIKKTVDDFLSGCKYYSVITDGWSNIRNEHLVNFIILVPNKKPFYYKSVDTCTIVQTAENIAEEIIKVVEEIGSAKLLSVITDNSPCMLRAGDLIEARYPIVFCNGCSAHVMNLVVKDICERSENEQLLTKCVFVVKFIKEFWRVLENCKMNCAFRNNSGFLVRQDGVRTMVVSVLCALTSL